MRSKYKVADSEVHSLWILCSRSMARVSSSSSLTTARRNSLGETATAKDELKFLREITGNNNIALLHSSSSSAMMDDESLMKSSQSSSKNQDPMAGNSNLDASDHESTSVKSATNNRSACSVIFPNHSTSLDNWLSKHQCAKKNKNDLPNDLGDWLMVPGPKKQLGNCKILN